MVGNELAFATAIISDASNFFPVPLTETLRYHSFQGNVGSDILFNLEACTPSKYSRKHFRYLALLKDWKWGILVIGFPQLDTIDENLF